MLRGSLPPDVQERLKALGVDQPDRLQFYSRLCDEKGAAAVLRYCERTVRSMKQLRAFSEERERHRDLPVVSEFSLVERCQYNLLVTKLSAVKYWPESLPDTMTIVHSSPLLGLRALYDVFGPPTGNVVYLTETERDQFLSEILDSPPEEDGWFQFRWWTIRSGPDLTTRHPHLPSIPDDCEYWEVCEGGRSGSLSGGATYDLWLWDGHEPIRVDDYQCIDTS